MGADENRASVAQAVRSWRQGDCFFGDELFAPIRFAADLPITRASLENADAEGGLVEVPVRGFAVVSQTCDVVAPPLEGQDQYVVVAPLVHEPDDNLFTLIKCGMSLARAYVPSLEQDRLVIALDQASTIEKGVLARVERVQGCATDDERRNLARSIERRFGRFAFPDDFYPVLKRFRNRVVDKYDRQTEEGRFLRSLREIRVRASPNWDAEDVELDFFFVLDSATRLGADAPVEIPQSLKDRLQEQGRYSSIGCFLVELESWPAVDYVESDALDLDGLSYDTDVDDSEDEA